MSTYETTSQEIGADFAARITAPLALPTLWPNQRAVPPGVDLMSTAWLRVAINWQLNRPEVIQGTSGRYRLRGEMIVSVFVPANTGTERASEIADAIVDAYRGYALGSILFETAEIRQAGVSGHWWQVNVHCPFYRDEVT